MLPELTPVGVSDHTPGNLVVPVASTALGAAIIEKHLKPIAGYKTEDDKFSLDPDMFKAMVKLVETTHEAMQSREFASNPSRQLRRSLYAVAGIAKGEAFTDTNKMSDQLRPGFWHRASEAFIPPTLERKADRTYRKGDRIT